MIIFGDSNNTQILFFPCKGKKKKPMLMSKVVIMLLAMYGCTEGKPQCNCKRPNNQCLEGPEGHILLYSHKKEFLYNVLNSKTV